MHHGQTCSRSALSTRVEEDDEVLRHAPSLRTGPVAPPPATMASCPTSGTRVIAPYVQSIPIASAQRRGPNGRPLPSLRDPMQVRAIECE
jgi:hypothetical protein